MTPSHHANPAVEVRKLVKRFGSTLAIRGVSFHVARGEALGLLGANGAGKTTAIHILLGITKPTSGELRILGMDPRRQRREVLQRCNFCSAYTALPGNLKVIENLRVFAGLYQVPNAAQRIGTLLERFEISHLRNRVSGQLSSGETARLNLCKALLNDPELLLLDEPTASLDPDMADKVRGILRGLRDETGLTMIYTSHNMRDVEEVCDRVIFMKDGGVLAEGAPAELLARFGAEDLEALFIGVARNTPENVGGGAGVEGMRQ